MQQFVSDLKRNWNTRPFVWAEEPHAYETDLVLPSQGRVLVLAPHPDDPESTAVTCRLLAEAGCDIRYTLVTMSPAGVEDSYAQRWKEGNVTSLQKKKIEIRRREQICSAELFGLPHDRLTFLGMPDHEEGEPPDSRSYRAEILKHLEAVAPDIVMLPFGKDTNRTHARVFQVFRDCAKNLVQKFERPIVAMYNEDPKTLEIRSDLFVLFGKRNAEWKGTLLRTHESQQQRNIHARGKGFDERILQLNRLGYERFLESRSPPRRTDGYAEVFELELFGII